MSDNARVTSASSRDRSRASTWMFTRNTLDGVGAHSTSTSRSGCSLRFGTFTQSSRCTETPDPRVTNPMIGSPGTGVQHLASLIHRSSAPLATTPTSCEVDARRPGVGVMVSAASSAAPSTPPAASTSLWTIVAAEIRPSPTEAYSAEMSAWFKSAAIVARAWLVIMR